MICIDACVLGSIITPEETSKLQLAKLENLRKTETILIAPTLLDYEIASILRKKITLQALTPAQGLSAYRFYKRLGIRLESFPDIAEQALGLCEISDTPLTTYDACYLVIAHHFKASLWTLDKTLIKAAKSLNILRL